FRYLHSFPTRRSSDLFIMILNYIKIPLQIFIWDNVTWSGLLLNLMAIPFIVLGGVTGIKVIKRLPEQNFKRIIQLLVIISSILIDRKSTRLNSSHVKI